MKVFLFKGDLTTLDVDAVVNAANGIGPMGGGVAYAIKKVGGHEIEQEAIKRCQEEGPFKPGQVYVTTGGSRWKYVIHAVTMMYPAEPADYDSAGEALAKAIKKAVDLGVTSVAVPALGMGVGGLEPKQLAQTYAKVLSSLKAEPINLVVAAFDKLFLMELINALD